MADPSAVASSPATARARTSSKPAGPTIPGVEPPGRPADPFPMERLRRAVIGAAAAAGGAAVGLALLFGVLGAPDKPATGSCTTGLYPGTYADLVTPVHLLVFGVLCGGLLALARAQRMERPTVAVLAAAAFVAACLIHPPLFGPTALSRS